MQPYKRSERVRKHIQHEICGILRDIKDPGLGFMTVTDVEMSDDLTEAKIYYSVYGDEQSRRETAAALERAHGYIRRMLRPSLNMRKVPNLQFRYDDTYERAEKVFALLNRISPGDPSPEEKDKQENV